MTDPSDVSLKSFFEQCYAEVRQVAAQALQHEVANHTLRPTDLVHLAYTRLCDQRNLQVADRRVLLAASAVAIRRVLVDHARSKGRLKRGPGERFRVPLDSAIILEIPADLDWIVVDEALEALEAIDTRARRLVELRVFAGCTLSEAADALRIADSTASDIWAFARAWLRRRLTEDP